MTSLFYSNFLSYLLFPFPSPQLNSFLCNNLFSPFLHSLHHSHHSLPLTSIHSLPLTSILSLLLALHSYHLPTITTSLLTTFHYLSPLTTIFHFLSPLSHYRHCAIAITPYSILLPCRHASATMSNHPKSHCHKHLTTLTPLSPSTSTIFHHNHIISVPSYLLQATTLPTSPALHSLSIHIRSLLPSPSPTYINPFLPSSISTLTSCSYPLDFILNFTLLSAPVHNPISSLTFSLFCHFHIIPSSGIIAFVIVSPLFHCHLHHHHHTLITLYLRRYYHYHHHHCHFISAIYTLFSIVTTLPPQPCHPCTMITITLIVYITTSHSFHPYPLFLFSIFPPSSSILLYSHLCSPLSTLHHIYFFLPPVDIFTIIILLTFHYSHPLSTSSPPLFTLSTNSCHPQLLSTNIYIFLHHFSLSTHLSLILLHSQPHLPFSTLLSPSKIHSFPLNYTHSLTFPFHFLSCVLFPLLSPQLNSFLHKSPFLTFSLLSLPFTSISHPFLLYCTHKLPLPFPFPISSHVYFFSLLSPPLLSCHHLFSSFPHSLHYSHHSLPPLQSHHCCKSFVFTIFQQYPLSHFPLSPLPHSLPLLSHCRHRATAYTMLHPIPLLLDIHNHVIHHTTTIFPHNHIAPMQSSPS